MREGRDLDNFDDRVAYFVEVIKEREKMLINIRKSKKTLRAYSNGGFQDSDTEGDFPGMFKVWYNPKSMLNILAFSDVRKYFVWPA